MEIDEAIKMLPDGDFIHTFRNGPGLLLGADHDREKLISEMRKHGVELAGEQAVAMGHGMVLNDGSYLFIQTKKPETSES